MPPVVLVSVATVLGRLHRHGALRAVGQGAVLPGLTWLLEDLGLARTTATSGSLLLGADTLATVLVAVLLLRGRLSAAGAMALVLGLAGTGLISLSGDNTDHIATDPTAGNILVIAAVICGSAYVVWSRRSAQSSAQGLGVTAWQFVGSVITVCPFVVVSWAQQGSRFSTARAEHWLAAGAVLACTIGALLMFNTSISAISASRAGLLLSLQPVAGAVTAVAVVGEPLTANPAIGGVLIVTALLVFSRDDDSSNQRGTPARPRPPAEAEADYYTRLQNGQHTGHT